jgi:hypothetical protein
MRFKKWILKNQKKFGQWHDNKTCLFKETVSRDCQPLVFFHKSTAPGPLINTLKYFQILF